MDHFKPNRPGSSDEAMEAAKHLGEGLKILARMIAREIAIELKATCYSVPNQSQNTPNRSTQDKLTLSVPEVAERLGISKGKAYELVHTKQIPSIRFGRRWLIPRIRFEAMLEEYPSFLNKSATP